jgi:chromosome partitioning protein
MKKRPHIIAFGNEKGGSGKSTTTMHVFVSLARRGLRVGALDLDLRQKSFFRYIDNRQNFCERKGISLVMPQRATVEASTDPNREKSWAIEGERFNAAIKELSQTCDVILIDCPGAHSNLSRLAHSRADTLVTPMNDSFIDFDLLARIDPKTFTISGPSVYAEMVWETRKMRAQIGLGSTDWVVVRNRMPLEDAANKRRVGEMLQQLSSKIGFRIANGLSERPIFREMFLSGLTLMDLRETGEQMDMSKIAARQEVRELMKTLNILPHLMPEAEPAPAPAPTPVAIAAPGRAPDVTPKPLGSALPLAEPPKKKRRFSIFERFGRSA